MKIFNSFQLTILFSVFPFIIGWLAKGPFPYSTAVFWIAIAAYIFHFMVMVACVRNTIDD